MSTNQFFLIVVFHLAFAAIAVAAPVTGKSYSYKLVDVDGRTLSATDRVTTLVVITSRRDLDKARQVGDRIPDRCLGSLSSRMITVIRFDPNRSRTARFLLTALIRRGLEGEAGRLKARYRARNLTRDPRGDIHAVADFDGQTAAQFDLNSPPSAFNVLVLGPNGMLLRNWSNVPSPEDLSAVLP